MPEFLIVRCFNSKCRRFQVQQRKKTNKWKCVVCNEKQSLKKVYGNSFKASDLRPLVQEYNMAEGKKKEEVERNFGEEMEEKEEEEQLVEPSFVEPAESKWTKYLKEREEEEEGEDIYNNEKFLTSLPEKGRKRGTKKDTGKKHAKRKNKEGPPFFEEDPKKKRGRKMREEFGEEDGEEIVLKKGTNRRNSFVGNFAEGNRNSSTKPVPERSMWSESEAPKQRLDPKFVNVEDCKMQNGVLSAHSKWNKFLPEENVQEKVDPLNPYSWMQKEEKKPLSTAQNDCGSKWSAYLRKEEPEQQEEDEDFLTNAVDLYTTVEKEYDV